ncbi:MAG: hypothetical protein RIM72_17115 [Alphaproteobacteria bacterium]
MFPKLAFLSVKGIPALFWSSHKPLNFRPRVVTMLFLVIGLTIFGLGEALLITAHTGVSPWTVLAQGVSNVTDWSLGQSTFVVSISVLALWIPLKRIPGIGTILNAVIIAAILEYVLPYIPTPESLGLQVLQALAGILVTGLGGAIYLICNLGPGPRDGLMTGLQEITNLPIAWVRSGIEVTVVLAGWWLGGTVGLGTILFAFLIGPAMSVCLFVLIRLFGNRPVVT